MVVTNDQAGNDKMAQNSKTAIDKHKAINTCNTYKGGKIGAAGTTGITGREVQLGRR